MAYKKVQRRGYRRPVRKTAKSRVRQMVGESVSMVEKMSRGVGSVARLAKYLTPVISAINTEEKYLDTATSVALPSATPHIVSLTGMAQGTTDITRIGDSIKARFLQFRVKFTGLFSGVNSNHIRLMLIVDKAVNAATPIAAPTLTQILQAPGNIMSPINKDQGDRFVILKDKQIILNNPGAGITAAGGDMRFVKLNIPLDFHVRFVANTATDLGPNQIYLVLWSDVVTTGPTANYFARFKWTDN